MNSNFQIQKRRKALSFKGVFFLIFYQFFTSLNYYFTPLIGLFFCYLILNKEEERKTHVDLTSYRYLAFLYLIFAVINKGFYLFSGVIAFYIFYYMFAEWLQASFRCKNCILITYVFGGYLGVFWINNLLAYMSDENFFVFGWEYGLYIFLDSILAIIIFRDKSL